MLIICRRLPERRFHTNRTAFSQMGKHINIRSTRYRLNRYVFPYQVISRLRCIALKPEIVTTDARRCRATGSPGIPPRDQVRPYGIGQTSGFVLFMIYLFALAPLSHACSLTLSFSLLLSHSTQTSSRIVYHHSNICLINVD